jgi:FKBP-type peptidyl-prolyl cis-trans isomerase FkpA
VGGGSCSAPPTFGPAYYLLAVFLLWGGAACGPDEPPPPPPALDPTELTFDPSIAVDLDVMEKRPSGLYVQDLFEGAGLAVRRGSSVTVHYTGWLHDGTRFDSSHDRNEPFPIIMGETGVIAGWAEGLVGMREGGRRKLVIPPHLAYGPAGRPPVIPPQATLVFTIEVLDVD